MMQTIQIEVVFTLREINNTSNLLTYLVDKGLNYGRLIGSTIRGNAIFLYIKYVLRNHRYFLFAIFITRIGEIGQDGCDGIVLKITKDPGSIC